MRYARRLSSVPDNIAVVERFYVALDSRDLDALAATVAPDAVWNTPTAIPFGGLLEGRDAVRAFVTDVWGFFTGYRNTRERIVADGDRVIVAGRHGGHTADGAEHDVPYTSVFTVSGGEIVAYAMQLDAGLVVRAVAGEFSGSATTSASG